MTDPAARAVIFGREAETYERARPAYPAGAIEYTLDLVPVRRAAEVGAGTGKATEDMARDGLEITCIEPSPEMAAILAAKSLPGVTVQVTAFEDWDGEPGSLDLIYAAQAWHWVDHDTAYRRVLDLLRVGGALALLWNVPLDRYEAFRPVYEEHAQELLDEHDQRIHKRDSVTWSDDLAKAGFGEVDRATFHWTDRLTAREVRALYSTYSDHMMLPDDQRSRLLLGLEEFVTASGGSCEIQYRSEVFSGRKT